jgi:hypothetical protein
MTIASDKAATKSAAFYKRKAGELVASHAGFDFWGA